MGGAFLAYEHAAAMHDDAWATLVGVSSDTSVSMFGVVGGSWKIAEFQQSRGQMTSDILGLQAAFSLVLEARTGAVGFGGLAGGIVNLGSAALWVNKTYAP